MGRVEEMRILGDLTIRTAKFLDAISGAYAFFAYGLSVPGVFMLSYSIFMHAGTRNPLAYNLAALAGVGLGTLLSTIIPSRPRRYTSTVLGGRSRRLTLAVAIVFTAGLVAGSILLALAGLENVSWYGGLTLALALEALLLVLAERRYAGESFLAASIILATGLPLVASLEDEIAGISVLMLAYLAGGSWALWRASKLLD